MRLERNPMRILDSKDEGDRAVVAEAPLLHEHLNQASRDFFARVQDGLARLGIEFRLSPRLVRGLDYYTHTAFEFVIEFGDTYANAPRACHTRIVTSPVYATALLDLLGRAVRRYEARFGPAKERRRTTR